LPAAGSILEVGLTGGIASGKTTVGGFLQDLGAFVVDADRVARVVVEPGGSAYDEVLIRFGGGIVDAAGRIDRPALGTLVFGDDDARNDLNTIIHPHVRAEARRLFDECAREGRSRVAVFDAALLVETGAYRDYDRLVVVSCDESTQLRRLLARGLDTPAARARIAAQFPLSRKIAVADHVIDTNGTLAQTRAQTDHLWSALLTSAE
jgi:dephospho-CoA kinase